jgi:hypothetical protein
MLGKLALAAALLAVAATAEAATLTWSTPLEQSQEVPPPVLVPGASGFASGTFDTVSGLLDWNISFSGLSGPATAAHFHAPAPPGVAVPPVIDVGIAGLDSPMIGSATLTGGLVDQFIAGLFYFNVHTALNPPGEIRGQIAPVPLPAALPLAVVALAAIGALAARRRRS